MQCFISPQKISNGFSLIEVLIGIAIASIGIVGIVELQKVYMKASSHAGHRLTAMVLANDKIDQLCQIQYLLLTTPSGGISEQLVHPTTTYTRLWVITNKSYIDGVWKNTSTSTPSIEPDMKIISITINWTDVTGQSQGINQQRYISRNTGPTTMPPTF